MALDKLANSHNVEDELARIVSLVANENKQ